MDCELCIVGAGYAALNALNAAAKYLNKGDRVVVIDRNETWGGQWLGQYDFVRLHQPYFCRNAKRFRLLVFRRFGKLCTANPIRRGVALPICGTLGRCRTQVCHVPAQHEDAK